MIIINENLNIKVSVMGMVLFIILSLYNNASWGASFSYVIVPSLLLLAGAFFQNTKIRKETLILFIFFIIYFISTIFSSYVEIGRDFITFFAFLFVLAIATSIKFTKDDLKIIIITYLIVSAFASINIIFNWLKHNYIQYWLQRSSFTFLGKFKDPNYVLAFSAPAAVLSIIIFLNTRNRIMKLSTISNFLLCVFSCLCAGTRAGMLSILIPMILMVVITKKLSIKTKIKVFLIAIICVTIGVFFVIKFYNEYALERMLYNNDGSGRLEIWKSAISVFKSNPLLGGGFNSGSSVSLITNGFTTHSILVDILCDSGIFGLLVFITYFITNCLICKRINLEFQLVSSCSFLIPMFFINGFNTTTFYFPIILISIFSFYCRNNEYFDFISFEKGPKYE